MSLDYTGANNGLFRHLGKLIKYFDAYAAEAADVSTGLDANRKEILDAFQLGGQDVAIEGLTESYESWKRGIVDRRATLSRHALTRLQDPASVLTQIGAATTDPVEILTNLFSQMLIDGQTIMESTVSLGSVTPGGGNVGDGKVITTTVLDGYSSPGTRSGVFYPAILAYKGLPTELCVPAETMTLQCVDDGSSSGSALFSWTGQVPDENGQYGISDQGSGSIGVIGEAHQNTPRALTNADFEDFTTPNVPDDWTIDAGTAGTHVLSNANLTFVSHALKSVQFSGDGAQASIQISQAVAASAVNAHRRYLVSAQIKADASIAAGTLTIQFEGTSYTPGGGESISIAPGSLPTAFDTRTFLLTMPPTVPADFKLVIKWTGTPSAGKSVYIDDVGVTPVEYGGGVGLAVVRGPLLFAVGDKFTFTVQNTEGVFQSAFRQMFGVQLPSDSSPTIADSLAT